MRNAAIFGAEVSDPRADVQYSCAEDAHRFSARFTINGNPQTINELVRVTPGIKQPNPMPAAMAWMEEVLQEFRAHCIAQFVEDRDW